MNEEAESVNEIDLVLSDLEDIPSEDEVEFPLNAKIEPIDLRVQFVAPTPAQNFQWTNQNKFSNNNLDLEGLVKRYWSDCVHAMHGESRKPSLMNLQGTEEEDRAFTIILNFFKLHFLNRT